MCRAEQKERRGQSQPWEEVVNGSLTEQVKLPNQLQRGGEAPFLLAASPTPCFLRDPRPAQQLLAAHSCSKNSWQALVTMATKAINSWKSHSPSPSLSRVSMTLSTTSCSLTSYEIEEKLPSLFLVDV